MLLTKNINPDAVDPRSVTMTVNGARVGDPLTDNNYRDDGYRFHDVFHLAHAAILGWSPILRALMKRKRRSNPELSRREDGRPSMIAEEGIVAMLFSYAERRNFLKSETQIEPLVMGTDTGYDQQARGQSKDHRELGRSHIHRILSLAQHPGLGPGETGSRPEQPDPGPLSSKPNSRHRPGFEQPAWLNQTQNSSRLKTGYNEGGGVKPAAFLIAREQIKKGERTCHRIKRQIRRARSPRGPPARGSTSTWRIYT